MGEGRCHYCENTIEVWECRGCKQLTCEDCFAPQSPMSVCPETSCLECTYQSERASHAEADRENDRRQAERERKDKQNHAARSRYWKPEIVAKRKADRAELKRIRAEAAQRRLAEAFRIVGGMMR